MAVELATGYISLVPSARGFGAGVQRELGSELEGLGVDAGKKIGDNISRSLTDRLQTAGRNLSSTGQALTLGITAPLVGIGVVAFKAATEFETAFAGVRKTVDGTVPQLARLRQGIIDMANEIPASRESIAAVAEAAGQLGVNTDSILTFTRVMVDLGNTTNLSAEEAANSLARLANITGLPSSQFDQLGSTVVDLGNKLAATESEIVELGLRLAGAGAQVGLSEAQILSFAGALSSVGIEAEAGGSALSRVFVELANSVASGGPKLEQFASIAGKSTADFQKAFKEDAAGAIVTFIEGLDNLSKSGGNVFAVLDELGLADIRVRDALLRAAGAGDLFRKSLDIGTTAFKNNNALQKEAAKRYETTASKLTVAGNKATGLARQFGESLAPAVISAADAAEPLLKAIGVLVQGFTKLPAPIQSVAVGLGVFLAAIGPISFFVGNALSGISGLVSGFGKITDAAGTAATGLKSFFTSGAGSGALDSVTRGADAVRAGFEAVASKIADASRALFDFGKQTTQKVVAKIEAKLAVSVAEGGAEAGGQGLASAIGAKLGLTGAAGGGVAGVIGTVALPIIAAVSVIAIGFALSDEIGDIPSKVAGLFPDNLEIPIKAAVTITGFFVAPVLLLGKFLADLADADLSKLDDLGGDIVGTIIEGIGDAFQSAARFVSDLPGSLGTDILTGLVDGARAGLSLVTEFFGGIPTTILESLASLPGKLLEFGPKIFEALVLGALTGVDKLVQFFVGDLPDYIVAGLSFLTTVLIPKGVELIAGLLAGAVSFVPQILDFFVNLPGQVIGWIGDVLPTLSGKGSELLQGLFNGLIQKLPEIVSWIAGLPAALAGGIGDVGGLLAEKGRQILQGLWNGLKEKGADVLNWVGDFAKKVIGKIGDIFKIDSPSKVMRDLGRFVMDGFQHGLQSGQAQVIAGLSTFGDQVTDALNVSATADLGRFSTPTVAASITAAAAPALVAAAVPTSSAPGVYIENLNSLPTSEAVARDIEQVRAFDRIARGR